MAIQSKKLLFLKTKTWVLVFHSCLGAQVENTTPSFHSSTPESTEASIYGWEGALKAIRCRDNRNLMRPSPPPAFVGLVYRVKPASFHG